MPFSPGTPTTPSEAAANWVSGSTAKSQKWVTNTLSLRVIFTQAAIANAPQWLAQIQSVGTAGYIAGMNRANQHLTQIANNIQTNGAASYSQGITNKQYKYAAAAQGLIPAIQQIVSNLPPRGTKQQNIQRATAFMTAMSQVSGQYRS
jgi:hypothetical protein